MEIVSIFNGPSVASGIVIHRHSHSWPKRSDPVFVASEDVLLIGGSVKDDPAGWHGSQVA